MKHAMSVSAPCLADLDNDGYPDILITTGSVYPELDRVSPKYALRTPTILFRNRGNGTFVELGADAGPGIVARHCSRGLAFGDFDNDGDMDVLIMNVNEPPSLLRNDAPAHNRWIKIRLEGVKSNRSAIGARVLAHYGGKVQAQEVLSQSGYLSASDPRIHFGLGTASNCRHRDPLAPGTRREVPRTFRRSACHDPGRHRHRKRTPLPQILIYPFADSTTSLLPTEHNSLLLPYPPFLSREFSFMPAKP